MLPINGGHLNLVLGVGPQRVDSKASIGHIEHEKGHHARLARVILDLEAEPLRLGVGVAHAPLDRHRVGVFRHLAHVLDLHGVRSRDERHERHQS